MRSGIPSPPRGATRLARRRSVAAWRSADATARAGLWFGSFAGLAASDSWLSSCRDQNQGTRNETARAFQAKAPASRPFSFIRTLTVGFGVAPNLLTLLPKRGGRRSRAWASLKETLTAGGDFHPALRTSAARNGRPVPKYDERPGDGQEALAWGNRMSPCPRDR